MKFILGIVAGLFVVLPRIASSLNDCSSFDSRIIVITSKHRLYLCEGGKRVREYSVILGRGGVGKTREGDGKVPLGTYEIGFPRPSKKYGKFIAIGYPTAKQVKEGYTGGSLGIHGPPRRYKWLGSLLRFLDLTEGCIELATDQEIEQISVWLKKSNARFIDIR